MNFSAALHPFPQGVVPTLYPCSARCVEVVGCTILRPYLPSVCWCSLRPVLYSIDYRPGNDSGLEQCLYTIFFQAFAMQPQHWRRGTSQGSGRIDCYGQHDYAFARIVATEKERDCVLRSWRLAVWLLLSYVAAQLDVHIMLLQLGDIEVLTTASRWGQAAALVNDVLYIHGGRIDQYNQYAYSSAPVNNDILYLPLNSSFELSSPPWEYVAGCANCTTSQGPAVAWHTLTPFNTSELLLFGGDAGPDIARPEAADSAAVLDASDRQKPQWDLETSVVANQPDRRMYHTACESNGKVFIVGGEKTDGSGNAFSDHYVYDPQALSFTQLPSTNGPPDLYGHASVVLSDSRMIVFGGYSPSENTLLPFSTIWSLDTTQSNYTWLSLQVSNTVLPSPRRGFVAVAVDDGKVLVQGGADADMQNVFSDGWVLDTTQNPMVWSTVDALSQVGARRDHFAVAVGSEVFLGFGTCRHSSMSLLSH